MAGGDLFCYTVTHVRGSAGIWERDGERRERGGRGEKGEVGVSE